MTTNQTKDLIGREGMWCVAPLLFRVRIIDVKSVYGRELYHIEPVSGSGTRWVSGRSVDLCQASAPGQEAHQNRGTPRLSEHCVFNEGDCGGVFDGSQVVSDADPGL